MKSKLDSLDPGKKYNPAFGCRKDLIILSIWLNANFFIKQKQM